MATYQGDATITGFDVISGSRSTTSGTTVLYTMPVGTFGEVRFRSASSSGFDGGISNSASFTAGAHALFSIGTTEQSKSSSSQGETFWINEGETIAINLTIFTTAETISCSCFLKQFNKP